MENTQDIVGGICLTIISVAFMYFNYKMHKDGK